MRRATKFLVRTLLIAGGVLAGALILVSSAVLAVKMN